jgi:small multidrug resistance family-3 protein
MILRSLLYFVMAGLCEIGGGYLVWLWVRESKSAWLALFGALLEVISKENIKKRG